MDSTSLPLHVKRFNEKVRAMNQSSGKLLTLNAEEARSLHAEIYDLMATVAELSRIPANTNQSVNISMDGGGFK